MLHAGIFLEMRESDCFLPLSRLPTATAVWFRCGVHFTSALPVDRHVLKLDVCLRSLIACGSTETKHMFLWHRWHPKQSEHWQSRIAWCSEASGGAILTIKQDPKRAVASSLLPPQLVSRVTTANPIFLWCEMHYMHLTFVLQVSRLVHCREEPTTPLTRASIPRFSITDPWRG